MHPAAVFRGRSEKSASRECPLAWRAGPATSRAVHHLADVVREILDYFGFADHAHTSDVIESDTVSQSPNRVALCFPAFSRDSNREEEPVAASRRYGFLFSGPTSVSLRVPPSPCPRVLQSYSAVPPGRRDLLALASCRQPEYTTGIFRHHGGTRAAGAAWCPSRLFCAPRPRIGASRFPPVRRTNNPAVSSWVICRPSPRLPVPASRPAGGTYCVSPSPRLRVLQSRPAGGTYSCPAA